MVKIAFEVSEGPLAALHQDTATFSSELRIAAGLAAIEAAVSAGTPRRHRECLGLVEALFLEARPATIVQSPRA